MRQCIEIIPFVNSIGHRTNIEIRSCLNYYLVNRVESIFLGKISSVRYDIRSKIQHCAKESLKK